MIKKTQFIKLIRQGEFKELFISELGWNSFRGQSRLPIISVDEKNYNIMSIAERNGFQILTCHVDEVPTQSIAKKIDSKLRKQAQDYICIYRLKGTDHDLWVVPVRANEKRDLVLIEYETAEKAELLYSKIDGFSFELDEQTNIVDLRTKVQGAFAVNSEKITKDFYAGFKKEHKAFAEFITGIDDHVAVNENKNKQWYTSVMLNRLMFCYFIQKKGFLNLDTDYLRNKLNWVRQEQGEDRFFSSFYKGFLSNLFHDGLNMPNHNREFERMYGKIPYLNGGMFEEHELERDYADIDIADEAFIRLFDFFDKWRWHLDTRITASGKDINPDVLGYIFEQYINDRAQMGAYYTKEDITEYISKNCILPFLIDRVKEKLPEAFSRDGYVWTMLRDSGDRYIYDAVRRGYKPDWKERIPSEISKGIITEEMKKEYTETPVGDLPEDHIPLSELRTEWNTKTPGEFALPTEIWRETIDRFQRCDTLRKKIKSGDIQSINDFITYNLDIRSFVYDLLHRADDHHFIAKFYKALQEVTILDPTCGSGAFLFAAMNILEPLYEVCIERMQEFNSQNPKLFKEELTEISNKYRSNIQYFIYKSIILRNLYGVDIMVEATEIAKLRLFLKMVAVVDVDRRASNLGLDPLPDIDFNIRCGNSLVGYANEEQLNHDLTVPNGDWVAYEANMTFKAEIDTEMRLVAMAYNRFRKLQMVQEMNMAEFKKAKGELRERLLKLNNLLNRRLFQASGHFDYEKWLISHQPFNWLAEFYQIIHDNGGFDVIIGNPPYVEISKSNLNYALPKINYKDLYAYVLDRTLFISNNKDYIGFIIPISFNTTPAFQEIYKKYINEGMYISCYSDTAKMFHVTKRLSIILKLKSSKNIYITKYIKNSIDMSHRLANAPYMVIDQQNIRFENIPAKISHPIEVSIINKYFSNSEPLSKYFTDQGCNLYYTRAIRNFRPFFNFIPCHKNADGTDKIPTETKSISVDENKASLILCSLNAGISFLIFSWFTDVRNINPGLINKLRIPIGIEHKDFQKLSFQLMKDYIRKKETRFNRSNNCTESYYFPVKSKGIIDTIDSELAKYWGFTDEELDFIINYDIKYRMGDELNN